MPETKLERLVLVLGLCAVAGLGFLVVRGKHHDARASAPPTTASTSAATASETGAGSPAQPAPAQLAHLVLSATGGDCWAVVRFGSVRGKVVFVGVIAQGTTKRFTGARLWFRLGAGGNVTGRLNGTRLTLPGGTPTILATANGMRVLAST